MRSIHPSLARLYLRYIFHSLGHTNREHFSVRTTLIHSTVNHTEVTNVNMVTADFIPCIMVPTGGDE